MWTAVTTSIVIRAGILRASFTLTAGASCSGVGCRHLDTFTGLLRVLPGNETRQDASHRIELDRVDERIGDDVEKSEEHTDVV